MFLVRLAAFCVIAFNATIAFAVLMIPSYPFTTGKDYTNFDNEYGSLEDSWKLVAAPAGVDGVGDFARVVAANPNWFNPEPYARWIAPPTANDGTSSFPAGTYVFEGQIEFLDHGFNNIPIEITGRYGSDDIVTQISVNNFTIFSGTGGGYSRPFPSTFGVIDQNNYPINERTIRFTVQNTSPGPVGLVVEAQKEILWDNYSGPDQQSRPESSLGPTTAKNLVLITHGYMPPLTEPDWAYAMQAAIRSYIDTHVADADNWDVEVCDWTDNAGGILQTVLANAVARGRVEGKTIAELGYEKVHLIGHSAGSALIDYAARQIKRLSPDTLVQETFLDAYAPGLYPLLYGGQADWAEQYFNTSDIEPDTKTTLTHAFNIDVTGLYDNSSSTGHAWPHEFYANSIIAPPAYEGFGFPLSLEASADWQPWTSYPAGDSKTLPSGNGTHPLALAFQVNCVVDFSQTLTVTSQTGEVTINGTGLLLTTGSPVWIISQLDLLEPADTLTFDLAFTGEDNSEGLLAVYFDDIVVGLIDERFIPPGTQNYQLYLGEVDPGSHTLSFRLDSYNNTSSSANIDNIMLGLTSELSGVPEPSTVTLLATALFFFSVSAQRMRRRR